MRAGQRQRLVGVPQQRSGLKPKEPPYPPSARQRVSQCRGMGEPASLAQMWHDQGKRAEAHDLLAPVYDWFTEGFATPVLQEAKALLEELAA